MSVPSSPLSASLEIAYLERLRDEFASPSVHVSPDSNAQLDNDSSANRIHEMDRDVPEEDGEIYEFRLFSAPSVVDTAPYNNVQRIAIRSPSPVNRDPGFVVPQRSPGYYFTNQFDVSTKEKFSAAAVSGEDVLRGLNTNWDATCPGGASQSKGKKRSGKKRRIAIRMKIQAAERNRRERETTEREKKTRMNRGKKVRRKMKEKAAKQEKLAEAEDVA